MSAGKRGHQDLPTTCSPRMSLLFGCRSRLVVGRTVYNMHYKQCDAAEKAGHKPGEHRCGKNYVGSSSKSMDTAGAVEIVKGIYQEGGFYVS